MNGSVTFWLVLNLAAGGVAATVYGLWAWKWMRRRAFWLAALNFIVMLACLGFALGYALLLYDPITHALATRMGFRYLAPIVLLVPAGARFVELRREERRDAMTVQFRRELRGEG